MNVKRAKELSSLSKRGNSVLTAHDKHKKRKNGTVSMATFVDEASEHDKSNIAGQSDLLKVLARVGSAEDVTKLDSLEVPHPARRQSKLMRTISNLTSTYEIRMVLQGLMGGLGQVAYVVILLILLIYVYAVAGIIFFGDCDPWNFGNLETTMLILLRVITLDTWGENYFTIYFGCQDFPGGLTPNYSTNLEKTTRDEFDNFRPGGIMYCVNTCDNNVDSVTGQICAKPVASPILAFFFFYSYIFIGTFGILSSVIGIISGSMQESLFISRRLEEKSKFFQFEDIAEEKAESFRKTTKHSRNDTNQMEILGRILNGEPIATSTDYFISKAEKGSLFYYYAHLSRSVYLFTNMKSVEYTVTATIFLSALSAGLETKLPTDPLLAAQSPLYEQINSLNTFITIIFTADIITKMIAEPNVEYYFKDSWNKFDVFVVVVAFIPVGSVGNFVIAMKMIRLLRLLKLVKRFRTLKIILGALSASARSIIMISAIMFTLMAIFAGIGVGLFGKNDPLHFDDVKIGFITMFQVMTLDSWAMLMYINMFGCDVIGYFDSPESCVSPETNFLAAALFFPTSVAILTWIMVTMFIGLLTTGMEESLVKRKLKEAVEEKTRKVLVKWKCTHNRIKKNRNVKRADLEYFVSSFEFLDFCNRDALGPTELFYALELAGLKVAPSDFKLFWDAIKKSNKLFIDYSEYLSLMLYLRDVACSNHVDTRSDQPLPLLPSKVLADDDEDIAELISYNGKKFLRSRSSHLVYSCQPHPDNPDEREELGIWNSRKGHINFYNESDKIVGALTTMPPREESISFKTSSNSSDDEKGGRQLDSSPATQPDDYSYVSSSSLMRPKLARSVTPTQGHVSYVCDVQACFENSRGYMPIESEREASDVVSKVEVDGVVYLRSKMTDKVYSADTTEDDCQYEVGVWNKDKQIIDFFPSEEDVSPLPSTTSPASIFWWL